VKDLNLIRKVAEIVISFFRFACTERLIVGYIATGEFSLEPELKMVGDGGKPGLIDSTGTHAGPALNIVLSWSFVDIRRFDVLVDS